MPHIIPLSNHNDNFARPPTDASIATHIENILKRNYVELASGRKLVPTKLGLVLANGYHLIDASLVLPQVRADIEKECDRIAKGLADKDAVLKKAIDIFATKFANFVENVNKMDVLFGSSFAKLQDVGQPFTRCGKTRHLSYIVGPPPRLYNKWTEEVFPLPSGGLIKQATGQKCPLCSFELCLYQVSFLWWTSPLYLFFEIGSHRHIHCSIYFRFVVWCSSSDFPTLPELLQLERLVPSRPR